MGPPDRVEFQCRWDYWILPGAFFAALMPDHLSSAGIHIGPFVLAINWGPYMRVREAIRAPGQN